MNEIVKVCKVHGGLPIEEVSALVRPNDKIYYRCKRCLQVNAHRSYLRHKEIVNQKAIAYHKAHKNEPEYKEKIKLWQKKARVKFVSKNRDTIKQNEQQRRDAMDDRYLKRLLTKNSILKSKDVSIPALLEVKRIELTIKRELKNEKH